MDTTHAKAKAEMWRLIDEAGGDLSRIEWSFIRYNGEWSDFIKLSNGSPAFSKNDSYEFRLAHKPMGRLPQVELPLAETEAPVNGAVIYMPYPLTNDWYKVSFWKNDREDFQISLKHGQIYLTAEDAIAVAKACKVGRVE